MKLPEINLSDKFRVRIVLVVVVVVCSIGLYQEIHIAQPASVGAISEASAENQCVAERLQAGKANIDRLFSSSPAWTYKDLTTVKELCNEEALAKLQVKAAEVAKDAKTVINNVAGQLSEAARQIEAKEKQEQIKQSAKLESEVKAEAKRIKPKSHAETEIPNDAKTNDAKGSSTP